MISILYKNIQITLQYFRQCELQRRHIKDFLSIILGKRKHILISERDYYRLIEIYKNQKKNGHIKKALLEKFNVILRRTDLLPIMRVPNDIITMNSQFSVLTNNGSVMNLWLVYPDEKDKSNGKISILSWTGMCLIGKQEGDKIRHNLTVRKILYQPEANYDFHL